MVTSGSPRKPGMSRDDLLKINAGVMNTVGQRSRACAGRIRDRGDQSARRDGHANQARHWFAEGSRRRTGRRARFGALSHVPGRGTQCLGRSVNAMVLGGHGDDMVPVRSYTTVGGVPIEKLIEAKRLDEIEDAHAQRRRRDRRT